MATDTTFSQWTYMAHVIGISLLVLISYAPGSDAQVISDIPTIQKYWGGLGLYGDPTEYYFGVKQTGLPVGCQIEQVQVLHRHAARYPSSAENEVISLTATKFKANQAGAPFTGPLTFLNTWTSQLGTNVLAAAGVGIAYQSGTLLWTRYGRLLYNATPGQNFYVPTNQGKPLLRSSTLTRVLDTTNAFAQGFFGLYNATSKYSLLTIPFVADQNSTISSFLCCKNYANAASSLSKSMPGFVDYAPFYLKNATKRLSQYAPAAINFTVEDMYSMQALCTYEYLGFGTSDFCRLFTLDEWKGFEYLYDTWMYNSASFGTGAGRALGIGVVQEMIARLSGQFITTSQTSVNSTLDSDPATFPLNQSFYFDATNDFVILATLTALSLDYFRAPLPLTYPPPKRNFHLGSITPYAGRLITEKIGCVTANPFARDRYVTQYSNGQYGYTPSAATYKFVRMRLGRSILPLKTIRGGACDIPGRTDGLCPLSNFVQSQSNAESLANYQFVCFGNYTFNSTKFTGDGTYSA
jgi:hypothetical protein